MNRSKPHQASGRPGRNPRDEGPVRLYGIHAVAAALANPAREIGRLLLTDNAEHRLGPAIAARKARAQKVSPRDLDRLLGTDTVHQGALLETADLPEPTLEELAHVCAGKGPLIVLDQVTDPHNVGAILRSAAVLGAAGLIMTRRHSPPLSGALAKAASGGLEVVPVALVGNLARALEELGELGVRRIGLDGDGEITIDGADFRSAVALVLGAEGKGLRRLTRESCDVLARVAAAGNFASLNVSNAAAVALYAAALARTPPKA
jgi:23S rRNA (guanosine2251-2'-O)-methyltransferase